MEHPTHEELLSYFEGDVSEPRATKVREHLDNCPGCGGELARLERTVQLLRNAAVPQFELVPHLARRVLSYAAAAAVLILLGGFAIGRLTSRPSAEFKREVIAQATQQIRGELERDLTGALSPSLSTSSTSFHRDFREHLNQFLTAAIDERICVDGEPLTESVRKAELRHMENQHILLRLLNEVRREHQTDYISLRRDLETVASVADSSLRRDREQLSELSTTIIAKNQN